MPRRQNRHRSGTTGSCYKQGRACPRRRGLPSGATLLVATVVPYNPHMALHALEDRPEDAAHLMVHQRGGPALLPEHIMALRSWASTVAGAEVWFHHHPVVRPHSTLALGLDQLTPAHPDIWWHSAALNAGCLSPTGYYWKPEAWGHTFAGWAAQTRHWCRPRGRPRTQVGGGHLGTDTRESRSFRTGSLHCTGPWPSLPRRARWLVPAAVTSRAWT